MKMYMVSRVDFYSKTGLASLVSYFVVGLSLFYKLSWYHLSVLIVRNLANLYAYIDDCTGSPTFA